MNKHEQIVEYCVKKILEQSKRPLLVAITGDSGSGKSHFSKNIEQLLTDRGISFTHIDHDDFLIPRKDREPMKIDYYTEGEFKGKSKWDILENMFYLDKYLKVIEDLKVGKESTYYPYLREIGDINPESKTVMPSDIIIFDTSMMLEHMDFVILIDVTQEEIIRRKLERDKDVRTPEQIIDMHKRVQGYYWERNKPTYADIVIDNNDYSHPKITRLE